MQINYHQSFKRDYKRIKKRGLDLTKLETVSKQIPLAYHYHDHGLTGKYIGFRECHVEPDWLLIYYIDIDNGIITLVRTGSHSDLF